MRPFLTIYNTRLHSLLMSKNTSFGLDKKQHRMSWLQHTLFLSVRNCSKNQTDIFLHQIFIYSTNISNKNCTLLDRSQFRVENRTNRYFWFTLRHQKRHLHDWETKIMNKFGIFGQFLIAGWVCIIFGQYLESWYGKQKRQTGNTNNDKTSCYWLHLSQNKCHFLGASLESLLFSSNFDVSYWFIFYAQLKRWFARNKDFQKSQNI